MALATEAPAPKFAPSGPGGRSARLIAWLPDLGAVLLFVALPLLYFWRLFTPNPLDQMTLAEGDFTIQFFPQVYAIGAIVRAGELPLWNPWSAAGMPLMADPQMGVWYPLNWALPWLVTDISGRSLVALEAHTVLHLSLLALFTYLLGRATIGSRLGALVAALTFAFAGFMTTHPVQQVPILRAAVWMPLLLLCLLRALDTFSVRWAVAAGLVLAVDIFAGHPQLLLFQLYGLLPFVAARLWQLRGDRAALLRACGLCALAGLLGAGVAAIQLLPSLEFMRLSPRAASSYEYTRVGLSPFELLLDLVAPRIVGGLPNYVGILPLLLALLAVRFVRQRWVPCFAIVALIGLLVAFGGNTVLHGALYLLAPGIGLFRHQERAMYLYAFGVSMLAGYGAAWLACSIPRPQRAALGALLRLAAVGLVGALIVAALLYGGYLLVEGTPRGARWREAINWWNWFVLMLAAALAVVALRLLWRRGRRLVLAALPALILLDLFTVGSGQGLSARLPDQVYVPSDIVRWLQARSEPYRLADHGVLNGNSGLVYLLPSIDGAFGLVVARLETLRAALPPERLRELLGVRYLVTREPPAGREVAIAEQWQEHTNRVLVLPHSLPPALVVPEARRGVEDAVALPMLGDPAFDPLQQVLIADDFLADAPAGAGTAAIRHRTANTLEVAVEASGGYLLLNETYYPGWRAHVDGGGERLVWRANYASRALHLAPGDQVVRLVYEPDSLRLGAAISTASLLLVAALLLARRARRTN